MRILDFAGNTVRQVPAPNAPGLHRVAWDMNRLTLLPDRQGNRLEPAAPGMYRAVLVVDGAEMKPVPLKLEGDPTGATPLAAEEEEQKPGPKFRRPED